MKWLSTFCFAGAFAGLGISCASDFPEEEFSYADQGYDGLSVVCEDEAGCIVWLKDNRSNYPGLSLEEQTPYEFSDTLKFTVQIESEQFQKVEEEILATDVLLSVDDLDLLGLNRYNIPVLTAQNKDFLTFLEHAAFFLPPGASKITAEFIEQIYHSVEPEPVAREYLEGIEIDSVEGLSELAQWGQLTIQHGANTRRVILDGLPMLRRALPEFRQRTDGTPELNDATFQEVDPTSHRSEIRPSYFKDGKSLFRAKDHLVTSFQFDDKQEGDETIVFRLESTPTNSLKSLPYVSIDCDDGSDVDLDTTGSIRENGSLTAQFHCVGSEFDSGDLNISLRMILIPPSFRD